MEGMEIHNECELTVATGGGGVEGGERAWSSQEESPGLKGRMVWNTQVCPSVTCQEQCSCRTKHSGQAYLKKGATP